MQKNQLAGLMKQAQAMQDNLKRAQEELARIEVEGQAGAGLVGDQRGVGVVPPCGFDRQHPCQQVMEFAEPYPSMVRVKRLGPERPHSSHSS